MSKRIQLYDIFSHWRKSNGTIKVHADTHFDDIMHDGIIINGQELAKYINSQIGKHDTIIFFGDCGNLEHFKNIRGYKILIKGNHDDKALSTYYEYFDEVYNGALIVAEKLILSHEPFEHRNMLNLHAHDHSHYNKYPNCFNLCDKGVMTLDNAVFEAGGMSRITSIHREAIDKQVERKSSKWQKV